MSIRDARGTRDELAGTLREEIGVLEALLRTVEDSSASTVQIASAATVLDQIGERRGRLLRRMREAATEDRMREEERSVRQFVLRALGDVKVPQNAGFIQEYVWATETVDLNTRGFGALRRDERRSWRRSGGSRLAYIVPALDGEGRALARWLARSDWPLERRVVTDNVTERLLEVHKVRALLDAVEPATTDRLGNPLVPLLGKYAWEILQLQPPESPLERDGWIATVTHRVEMELSTLDDIVIPAQQAAAAALSVLPEVDQLWGVTRSA